MRFFKDASRTDRAMGKPTLTLVLHRARAIAFSLALVVMAGTATAQDASFDPMPNARADLVREARGMHMLDYSRIRLSNGGDFDLFGIHYFQRLNNWLYAGVGAYAPMLEGNAGGFFGFAGTLHAQRNIGGNWFVNAGIAAGAGAGGSSIANIGVLSGEGLYGRAYVGVGYTYRNLSFGVNYSRIAIRGSQIDDSTLTFFVQRPFSFSYGLHRDAGTVVNARDFNAPEHDNILSLSFGNMAQINPTGSYTGDIGIVSTQYSSFHSRNFYTFFGVNMGFSGLSWYNQAQAGFGYRHSFSPNLHLYSQLGIGSAGWVTDHINTGPGIIVYPRMALEYTWNNGLGVQLYAGYLHALRGTSRNWTFGLGLNYHIAHGTREPGASLDGADYALRGIRLNVFGRRTSDIFYNGRTSAPLSMIAVQADYALNENWYVAAQLAVAANRFRGFAGYAEGFVGLGWQTNLSRSGRLQGYAQLLLGLNDLGVTAAHENGPMLYPAVGVHYHLNDHLSVYGQLGVTHSINQYLSNTPTVDFENYSVGVGMSYRFSLLSRS